MWRRCKSRRERWCRRRGRGGRRRGGGEEVVGCLSQSPPPVQLYLPDPLGDANDLITVSLCTARDLNGVLIASNAAIWQRDAVHLKKLPPPAPFATTNPSLWKLLKQAARHFHCQLELHFTYLRLQIRSALVCKSVQVLEATTLPHPILYPAPLSACCACHNVPVLEIYFCISSSLDVVSFVTKCQCKLSRSVAHAAVIPQHISELYIKNCRLSSSSSSSKSTLNLWPCDYCFTCLRISVSVSRPGLHINPQNTLAFGISLHSEKYK